MSAKEVKLGVDARDRMLRGVEILQQRGESNAGPEGPQRRARQVLRRSSHHQERRHCRQGNRLEQVREHGRAVAREVASKSTDAPATAPPRPGARCRYRSRKVRESVAAGMEIRWTSSEASTSRWSRSRPSESVEENQEVENLERRNRPGWYYLGERRHLHRPVRSPSCDEKVVGNEGRHHRSKKRSRSTLKLTSSKECSSTAAASRPTSSPTPTRCVVELEDPTFSRRKEASAS